MPLLFFPFSLQAIFILPFPGCFCFATFSLWVGINVVWQEHEADPYLPMELQPETSLDS